ncbi:MAG TPA: PilW family protein [Burkholderiaceae bacterium]|nr:PilW family protein [Burkholderiaceae bacterium]
MTIRCTKRRIRGMTLVELMIGLLVGMLLTLAAVEVLSTFEGRRRTLTSVNDIEQAGQVALYKIDHWLRGGGAGLPQATRSVAVATGDQANSFLYGCPLRVAKSNTKSKTQLLPLTRSLDAPFDKVYDLTNGVVRLLPVLILPGASTPGMSGQASDVLLMMTGLGETGASVAMSVGALPGDSSLPLRSTLDFAANDLVLVADQQPADNGKLKPCMVEQVANTFTSPGSSLTLDGEYYSATIGSTSLSGNFSSDSMAINLGNAGTRMPSFLLLGVGDNDVLYSYDLLQLPDSARKAQADGVFELHALYGVDNNGDGAVDAWVSPSSGSYSLEVLAAGDQTAATNLARIKAVRVGLIMRTSLPEKDAVTTGPLVLFPDLPSDLKYTRALKGEETHYRYRTMEAIVPVRNNLLLQM